MFGKDYLINSDKKQKTNSVLEKEKYELHYDNYGSLELHKWAYLDWKNHIDKKCQSLHNCFDDKLKKDEPLITLQDCSGIHRNEWALFQDAIDEKSNLTKNQIIELKDYWHNETKQVIDNIDKLEETYNNLRRPNRKH